MRTLTIEETNILGGGIWNPMPGEDPTMGMDGQSSGYTRDLGQLNAQDTVNDTFAGTTSPGSSEGGSSIVQIILAPVTIVGTRDWCGTAYFPAREAPLGNDFSLICKAHDGCIDLGTSREICDAEMKQSMALKCATDGNVACTTVAAIYGVGITVGTIADKVGTSISNMWDSVLKVDQIIGNPMGDMGGNGP